MDSVSPSCCTPRGFTWTVCPHHTALHGGLHGHCLALMLRSMGAFTGSTPPPHCTPWSGISCNDNPGQHHGAGPLFITMLLWHFLPGFLCQSSPPPTTSQCVQAAPLSDPRAPGLGLCAPTTVTNEEFLRGNEALSPCWEKSINASGKPIFLRRIMLGNLLMHPFSSAD